MIISKYLLKNSTMNTMRKNYSTRTEWEASWMMKKTKWANNRRCSILMMRKMTWKKMRRRYSAFPRAANTRNAWRDARAIPLASRIVPKNTLPRAIRNTGPSPKVSHLLLFPAKLWIASSSAAMPDAKGSTAAGAIATSAASISSELEALTGWARSCPIIPDCYIRMATYLFILSESSQ